MGGGCQLITSGQPRGAWALCSPSPVHKHCHQPGVRDAAPALQSAKGTCAALRTSCLKPTAVTALPRSPFPSDALAASPQTAILSGHSRKLGARRRRSTLHY